VLYEPPVNVARSRHDAIAVDLLLLQTEVGAPVGDETVGLDERALVQQEVDSLAGREFPFRMLGRHTGFATTQFGLRSSTGKQVELVAHGHGGERYPARWEMGDGRLEINCFPIKSDFDPKAGDLRSPLSHLVSISLRAPNGRSR